MTAPCTDRVALDEWYAVQAVDEMPNGSRRTTVLLDARLVITRDPAGAFAISVADPSQDARSRSTAAATARSGAHADPPMATASATAPRVNAPAANTPPANGPRAGAPVLPSFERYGYLWTSLGTPPRDLFEIPEYLEADRRNMNGASLAVRTSSPRVVENFLDLGHFATVHTGYLGAEPHTEIKPYQVTSGPHEVLATDCRVYQPLAALSAKTGLDVAYTYRVPHPYCAILYKSCAVDVARRDVIGVFVQPVAEDRSIAHMFLSMIDTENSDAALKSWQQLIFGQDKPILENQLPARLPLAPTAEIAIRADATSVAYRRWLRDRNVRYGTLGEASA